MLGWFSKARVRACRSKRARRSPSWAKASGRILIATSRWSFVSRARYTSPMPPAPIWSVISYGPSRVPGANDTATRSNYTGMSRREGLVTINGEVATDCSPSGVTLHFATPNKLPRDDLTSLLIDERKAEARGVFAKLSKVTRPLVGLVGVRARILIDEVAFEDVIHEDGQLARCRGDGVWLAQAGREATIECPQGRGRATERGGCQPKRLCRAIG